jgi:hypothetical protein
MVFGDARVYLLAALDQPLEELRSLLVHHGHGAESGEPDLPAEAGHPRPRWMASCGISRGRDSRGFAACLLMMTPCQGLPMPPSPSTARLGISSIAHGPEAESRVRGALFA